MLARTLNHFPWISNPESVSESGIRYFALSEKLKAKSR
jgi:hypothetical protein